jgi:AcrR family transcriptional regulator
MRQPLTRDAISTAAREILVAEGLHNVSLRKVASRLGVTAPALYAHVADKRDLLQGIAESEINRLVEQFESVQGDDPIQRIRQQCRTYVDYACANPDLFRAMFLFRPELTSEPFGDTPALGSRLFAALERTVREAIQRGSFGGEVDPGKASLTIWTAAHGAATMLLSGPPLEGDVRNRLADAVVEAVLAGLPAGVRAAAA